MLRSPEQMEAREQVLQMKMRRLALAEPAATVPPPPAPTKPPYSKPEEIAKRWGVSGNTIRTWFRDESGVIQWGRPESRPGKKRAHLSMRIPPEVEDRVRRRLGRA